MSHFDRKRPYLGDIGKKAGVLLRRHSENIPAVPVDHFCTGVLNSGVGHTFARGS